MKFPQLHFCPEQLCKSLVSWDSVQLPPLQLNNFNILFYYLFALFPIYKVNMFFFLKTILTCLISCKKCPSYNRRRHSYVVCLSGSRRNSNNGKKSIKWQSTTLQCSNFWTHHAILNLFYLNVLKTGILIFRKKNWSQAVTSLEHWRLQYVDLVNGLINTTLFVEQPMICPSLLMIQKKSSSFN